MKELPENMLLIDKPAGITSFGVIRELRKKLSIKKIGHSGTLDPAATGLLLVGVGEGTKKLNDYVKLDKEYEAEILIGESRTTGDMEGEIVESVEVGQISEGQIKTALEEMIGTLKLMVSAYSAIKKDGVPMYKRARRAERAGQTLPESELPIREMRIYEAEFIKTNRITNDTKKLVVIVRFKVSSGTYVRSLAEELGRKLGYPATLKKLRRTKVGEFSIQDARKL